MRNPFRRVHVAKINGEPEPSTPASAPAPEPAATPAGNQKPKARPYLFTEQTIDYLKSTEPDDILELMLPRLVLEQQNRLSSTARELEAIDQKLAKLYASREDIYNVMAQNQSNGVADF